MGTKRKKIILSVIAIILLVLIIVITFIYIFGKKNHNKDIITIDDGLRGTWNIYQIEKTASDGEIMIIDYKAVFAEVKKNNKINIFFLHFYINLLPLLVYIILLLLAIIFFMKIYFLSCLLNKNII